MKASIHVERLSFDLFNIWHINASLKAKNLLIYEIKEDGQKQTEGVGKDARKRYCYQLLALTALCKNKNVGEVEK